MNAYPGYRVPAGRRSHRVPALRILHHAGSNQPTQRSRYQVSRTARSVVPQILIGPNIDSIK